MIRKKTSDIYKYFKYLHEGIPLVPKNSVFYFEDEA